MKSKKWYTSKTLWINALAGLAILAQAIAGYEIIDAEVQVGILAIINLVVRLVTNQPLSK